MKFLDHLLSRHLDVSKYPYMKVCKDTFSDFLYIPLYNLSGMLIGYQTYRKDFKQINTLSKKRLNIDPKLEKYFTYISKVNNVSHLAVFGLESLSPKNGNVCYLVEGVFDAVVFHNNNLNCIAILGVGNKPNKKLIGFLYSLNYTFIAVCDGDYAGKNLRKLCDSFIELPDNNDPSSIGNDIIKYL